MNTITPDINRNLRTKRGDPAPRPTVVYCPCCDETRVSDKYQICTACQKYLGAIDQMMASE
jgi:hypothetical protein